jgi:GNAT superfamily N-acetyltransferase
MQLLVMVSVDITDRWYDAPNGRIPPLLPTDPSVGSHTVLLIGYDDLKAEFKFQNSWGVNWGDRGFGYIPYEVFRATWVEGWLEDFVGDEVWSKQESGVVERSWGVKEHGGGVFHCREFVGPGEERIGWAFAVERAGVIEVEELFVMPQFRGKGYGTKLIRLMGKLATDRGAPLRIWISHADNTPENLAAVENLVRQLGLRVVTSRVRWASHIASAALAASRFG